MSETLTTLAQATPEWLTATLQANGTLSYGRVEAIAQRAVGASSQVAYLTIRYSADAPSAAPIDLLLKIADPELEQRMPRRNRAEIAFYSALATTPRALPVVRSYSARYAVGNPDRFHLLLADPTATTHIACPYSAAPPTMEQSTAIIDALARIHAHCWDDQGLGAQLQAARPAELQSGTLTEAFIPWATEAVPRFISDLGDRLTARQRDVYRQIGATIPARLVVRQNTGRALTLTQGDVHRGNFLYPRDSTTDTTLVIDWKRAGVTVGANDLAYMMALYWFPAIRAQREQTLLRRYHEQLCSHGVTNYSWDDLWEDYRLCVLRQFFEAVWGWSVRQNSTIWWNHLERITLAIEDLNCRAFL